MPNTGGPRPPFRPAPPPEPARRMHSEAVVLSGNGEPRARPPNQAPAAAVAQLPQQQANGGVKKEEDAPQQQAGWQAPSLATAAEGEAPRKAGSGGLVVKLSRPQPSSAEGGAAATGQPQVRHHYAPLLLCRQAVNPMYVLVAAASFAGLCDMAWGQLEEGECMGLTSSEPGHARE